MQELGAELWQGPVDSGASGFVGALLLVSDIRMWRLKPPGSGFGELYMTAGHCNDSRFRWLAWFQNQVLKFPVGGLEALISIL